MGALSVGQTVAKAARATTLTKAQHAQRAMDFGRYTRHAWGGVNAADMARLPKATQAAVEALQKVDNYVKARTIVLGLSQEGWTSHAAQLAPSQLAAELAGIEKVAGKKVSTLFAEGAKTKGFSEVSRDALTSLSRKFRGGLANDGDFVSALKLERMRPPPPPKPLSPSEQSAARIAAREAMEASDQKWAAEQAEAATRAWGSHPAPNWANGNHPSQAKTSLFVR